MPTHPKVNVNALACDLLRFYSSYLEGEPVLAGAEPHVLHGGAVDHHLSHVSAGHKHWSAGRKEESFERSKSDDPSHPQPCLFCLCLDRNVPMRCRAAGSRCGVHEVAVSKYGVTCSCIRSRGARSHCESAPGDALWWNAMHFAPPNFPFQMKVERLFIHLRCVPHRAL